MSHRGPRTGSATREGARRVVRRAGGGRTRTLFLLLTLLVTGLQAPALQAQVVERGETVLTPGDALRVTVWRRPELSGEFAIAENGSVTHPLLRSVSAAGVPLATVEARMREYLSTLEASPQFVLEPLLRVSVGGEVRQPSLYRLPPETSIAEAVALAGGATERGRLEAVRLFRGGEEVRVDLTRPEAGLAQEPIRSGDQLFVERRVSVFREYIAPGASVVAAIAALVRLVI
jgi:protein involved in polysaccharide export with SLBB domain